MSGWSVPTAIRQRRAAERRAQAVAVAVPGLCRKLAARHLGVSVRTLNRYLKDAR